MVSIFNLFKSKPQIEYREKIVEKVVYQRSYNAAKIDRLNEDFRVSMARINEDIRNSLTNLRGRSRQSAQNNDYYIRYLDLYVSYIIGSQGFTLVNRGKDDNGKADKEGNNKVERAWKEFGKKKNFSFNKRETFFSFQKRACYGFARDGEVFIRIHKGVKNGYGVAFSIIDPDFLDETYNVDAQGMKNGNHISQGIEFDSMGNAIRYHFTDPKLMNQNYGGTPRGGEKIIVDASDIIHWFNKVEVNQIRGFPPAQNLLLALHGLSELNDSEMVSFRAGSCKMGFIQQKFPSEETNGFDGKTKDANGNYIDEIQAGLIEKLDANEEFIGYNPDHKSGNWETFSKGILRSAASGCGFPYPLLANDYSGLSQDGVALMVADARDYAISMQNICVGDLIDPIYETVYPYMFFKVALPYGKIDKFSDHEFRGRAFKSLRPLEDAKSMEIFVNNAIASRTKYNRDLNLDIDDTFAELEYEEEMAKDTKVPLRNQGGTTAHNINDGGTV